MSAVTNGSLVLADAPLGDHLLAATRSRIIELGGDVAQPGFTTAMQRAREALAGERMERAKNVAAAVARAGIALEEMMVLVDPYV